MWRHIIAVIAVVPLALIVSHEYSANDWQYWGFMFAAFWLRVLGPLADKPRKIGGEND